MKIKRTIDTTDASYDILELTKRQFNELFICYEKQMYIYRNRQMPDEDNETGDPMIELYLKLKKMSEESITII